MGKNFNFTSAFAVCLALSALPIACGDDEEEPAGKGGSSTGGSAGKGGTGTGGSTGGTGGKGTGGTTGGSAGKGTGGTTGGSAGKGGTAGTAGMDGGMGGAEGGMGGEGGNGGPMSFTCAEVCARVTAATSCADDTMCQAEVCWTSAGPSCDDETQALHDCLGATPISNFSCQSDKPIYDYGSGGCDTEYDNALLCVPK